ncbi:MAG: DUF350 domain-containing protein [Verrucomicrobiales bacterium]|nr:DUF350 domain-containing protein [Verrucomicrobiales bacterium]
MKERIELWLDPEPLTQLIGSSSIIYFIVSLSILWLAKIIKSRLVSYQLNTELTTRDNKAVAVATAGYLLAVMIVIRGVLLSDSELDTSAYSSQLIDVAMTLAWSLVAIVLLLISAVVNDKFLLHSFSNRKELIQDRNVGTGAVVAASYIGTALLISSAVKGASDASFAIELTDTVVYFIAGQAAFIIMGIFYQKLTSYDIHAQIEQNNAAAGVSFGMTLVAMALLLSGYLQNNDSLLGFAAWIPLSLILLFISRFAVDKIVLPQSDINEEIAKDQNWGVALLEGSVAIGIALILNASFS